MASELIASSTVAGMGHLLFTDLDGSLLNHDDYSWAQALPAIERLTELGIPIIMATSKTRAEVRALQREMGLEEPFVVENGGGVFFPDRYADLRIPNSTMASPYRLITLGVPYPEVRSFIEDRHDRFAIEGFGDMGAERIAAVTGLTLTQARLAEQRDFTEPFLLEEADQLAAICEEASGEGLTVTSGGRFHHLIGVLQNKGRAVDVVTEIFRDHWGEDVVTIALGDSPNDLSMLERVDYPIVIPRVNGPALEVTKPGAQLAPNPGCRGWNAAVLELLQTLYS